MGLTIGNTLRCTKDAGIIAASSLVALDGIGRTIGNKFDTEDVYTMRKVVVDGKKGESKDKNEEYTLVKTSSYRTLPYNKNTILGILELTAGVIGFTYGSTSLVFDIQRILNPESVNRINDFNRDKIKLQDKYAKGKIDADTYKEELEKKIEKHRIIDLYAEGVEQGEIISILTENRVEKLENVKAATGKGKIPNSLNNKSQVLDIVPNNNEIDLMNS